MTRSIKRVGTKTVVASVDGKSEYIIDALPLAHGPDEAMDEPERSQVSVKALLRFTELVQLLKLGRPNQVQSASLAVQLFGRLYELEAHKLEPLREGKPSMRQG